MAPARRLTQTGRAGAAAVAGVAAWTALNRAAVRRYSRRPDPVDPRDLSMPADRREHTLTMSDGWDIHVVETGPEGGPVVLLLHGITLAAAVWPYQLSALAGAGLRVVAPDMRGHGLSGGAADATETGTG
ncbi:MAG TPA: alpha/beta fold hydrolase, partial [Acidimicrobiales bacterium]|nr:alpha/beta fold hydrolase [Acidimicrobiales bacterium]